MLFCCVAAKQLIGSLSYCSSWEALNYIRLPHSCIAIKGFKLVEQPGESVRCESRDIFNVCHGWAGVRRDHTLSLDR